MDVTRETFKGSDDATQNLILFDSIQDLGGKLDAFTAGCSKKHAKIDKDIKRSGNINKGISAGSGLFGGFLAVLMSKLFGG